MNVQTVIAVIAIIAAFVIYSRHRRSEQPQEYDAAELHDAIKALYALSEQLENADSMLADLNACNPRELLRSFRANWCGIDGKRRTIDLLATGKNQTTKGLMTAAQEQRDQINTEIIATVRAMQAALDNGSAPALHLDAVGESVDETTETAEAGEW